MHPSLAITPNSPLNLIRETPPPRYGQMGHSNFFAFGAYLGSAGLANQLLLLLLLLLLLQQLLLHRHAVAAAPLAEPAILGENTFSAVSRKCFLKNI